MLRTDPKFSAVIGGQFQSHAAVSTCRANFRRGAYSVDKILKSTSPCDLPVELPNRTDFATSLDL
jgi:hypothetical protein